jgi:hypothetical protein
MKKIYAILAMTLLFTATVSLSEQKVTSGNFELHYNTFPSTFLSKEVANANQIQRSKNRGIVSISVLDTDKSPSIAVEANVTITAKNLLNQKKDVKLFKIVEESKAIYYLGTFALNNQEDINFLIEAKPTGSDITLTTKFNREFFTD